MEFLRGVWEETAMADLDLALVHYPVVNRNGERIAATCDEFDFFDISRLSLTYPLRRFYVVQPVAAQQAMLGRLMEHARGEGRDLEGRGDFSKTETVETLDQVLGSIEAKAGQAPWVVATSAHASGSTKTITFRDLRSMRKETRPILVLIGKAWGLAPELLDRADLRLEPIATKTGFNHLSVRAATAIIIDRLLGRDP